MCLDAACCCPRVPACSVQSASCRPAAPLSPAACVRCCVLLLAAACCCLPMLAAACCSAACFCVLLLSVACCRVRLLDASCCCARACLLSRATARFCLFLATTDWTGTSERCRQTCSKRIYELEVCASTTSKRTLQSDDSLPSQISKRSTSFGDASLLECRLSSLV